MHTRSRVQYKKVHSAERVHTVLACTHGVQWYLGTRWFWASRTYAGDGVLALAVMMAPASSAPILSKSISSSYSYCTSSVRTRRLPVLPRTALHEAGLCNTYYLLFTMFYVRVLLIFKIPLPTNQLFLVAGLFRFLFHAFFLPSNQTGHRTKKKRVPILNTATK